LEEHFKHTDKLKEKMEMISTYTWTNFIGDTVRDIPHHFDQFYIQVLCFLSACCQNVDPTCAVLSNIVYVFVSDMFVI